MQAEIFLKAAGNGDLAQIRVSIAAGVSANSTDEVRNHLCLNSCHHISVSLYHSFFNLIISYCTFCTIIPSLFFHRFALSLLSHRSYLWLCLFHLRFFHVPSFSHCLFNHILFVSFLPEIRDYISLSLNALSP